MAQMGEVTLPVTRARKHYVPLLWELPASIESLRASELPEGERIPGKVCEASPD